jgi:hypothetical protein
MNPLSSALDFGQPVQDFLLRDAGLKVDLNDLKFSSSILPRLRLKRKAIITKGSGGFTTSSLFEVTVEIPVSGFLINVQASTGGSLAVGLLNNGGTLNSLLKLLVNGPSENDATPSEPGILDNWKLWKVVAQLPGSSPFSRNSISFLIGFTVTLHLTGQDVVIGLSYDTGTLTFSGSLLFQNRFLSRLNPDNNDLEDLTPGMLANLAQFYDLATVRPFNQLPSTVPTRLTRAIITYTKASGTQPYELNFSASMAASAAAATPTTASDTVPFPFDWSGISLNYRRLGASGSQPAVNSLNINSTFQLLTGSGKFVGGNMFVSFSYAGEGSTSLWNLTGNVSHLQMGAIAQFFDPKLSGQVLDIIGKLDIDTIDVSYTYQANVASSFLFSGVITFGDLQLQLYYQYVNSATASAGTSAAHQAKSTGNTQITPIDSTGTELTAWRLDAYLNIVGGATTIGDIANSIVDNASQTLPDFIGDISVAPSGTDHLISLHCGKTTGQTSNGESLQRVIFSLGVAVSTLEFNFEQVSSKIGASQTVDTKRLLRVSAGQLPFLNQLPVVKELPQPWQKLQYMWVTASGLTKDEVQAINDQLNLDSSDNKLYFKPASKDDTVVLVSGHHFVIVYNDQAVLDLVFGSASRPPSGSKTTDSRTDSKLTTRETSSRHPVQHALGPARAVSVHSPDNTVSSDNEDEEEKPPAKGALKLNTGILDITAVSLQYKAGRLYIFLDATVKLGPLELSLIGFGVGLNISRLKLNDLSSLSTLVDDIDFQLRGMEVAFDKPPILIAGCFYHDVTTAAGTTVNAYRGGIAVTVPPYGFVAVGEYAVVTNISGEFKSVFVYAKLDGPIVDFEFAILRGLRIGFGYNSAIRSPAVNELYQFPLIDDGSTAGAGNVSVRTPALR